METVTTAEAIPQSELNLIAVNRIVEQAARLSRDRELDLWRDVYEPAKKAMAEIGLTPDEYQHAIAELTEALNI